MINSHFSFVDAPADADSLTNSPVVTANSGRAIVFSSPKPWVLAIVLSVGLWTVLGLSIWRFLG